MLDIRYYEGLNINDKYGVKKDVLNLLDELEGDFDKRLRKLFGPQKVKKAAVDVRRSCRVMIDILKEIQTKVQMTKEDYNGDYEEY
jgi:hypothetical protein